MGGKILAGAQNAAGVVLDALQDDVSEETPVDQVSQLHTKVL